ncbi:MAG TPA: hypothetical protein VM778_01945 [Gemmatimonadota bacterium]|nr:hypothetical protein [Gemmatimonadota bacterium]
MSRRLLPLAVAATALLPAPALAQRTAPAELLAAARAVTREVAAIRRLPALRPIDFQVSDRATIQEFARRSLEEEMGPAEWRAYDLLLTHTGLIPDDVDLQALVLELYVEQIAGYYDPVRKTFYLADWLPQLLQRAVVAHEVTHALQDQHFDLESWLAELSPTEDAALARAAVAEGDAMVAMLAYMLAPTGMAMEDLPGIGELLQGEAGRVASAYPTFDRAPKALQRLLMFPYVEGADFVMAAYRSGGWEAVNALYADPPVSTEQVLHPERYRGRRDDPRPVEPPAASGGSEPLIRGSWGEFGVGLVLEAGLGDTAAARAGARGWDGDAWALHAAPGGGTEFVWALLWDDAGAAKRFAGSYAQAIVRRFPGSARMVTGEGRFEFDGSGRRLEMAWSDDRVEVRERQSRGAGGPARTGTP